MGLTPRKDEVAAVVAVLESEDYPDANAMAKDVIKRVAELLAARDSFGVHAEMRGPDAETRLAMGPYWTKKDAEKALESAYSAGLHGYVAALHSTESIRPPLEPNQGRCECLHRRDMHTAQWGCAVYRCKCSLFTEPSNVVPLRPS